MQAGVTKGYAEISDILQTELDEKSILLWYNFAMGISETARPCHAERERSICGQLLACHGEIRCFAPAQHDMPEMVFNGFNL